MLRPAVADGEAPVLAVSALARDGIDKVWQRVERDVAAQRANGARDRRRAAQAQAALWSEIGEGLVDLFKADARVAKRLAKLEAEVAGGGLTPAAAARTALAAFRGRVRAT